MPLKKLLSPWLSMFIILILALALRIPLLNGSFWLDEAAQALESNRPLSQQLHIRDDFQPPLLHLLLHFGLYGGSSEWWLRTVGALIPALVTIFFTFKIGRLIKNNTVGIFAAILLATSSFHIFYSQELRPYSLPAMFAVMTWYMWLKIWKINKPPKTTDIIIFALLTAGGLYSSYLYPFLIISQVVWWMLAVKKYLWHWTISLVTAAILFLPWIPSFFDQLHAGTDLQTTLPGWSTVVSPTQLKAFFLVGVKFIFGVQDFGLQPFFILATLVIMVCCCIIVAKRKLYTKGFHTLLPLVCWAVIPVLTAWLISFLVPVLQPKRVLFCLPALYLLVATLSVEEIPSFNLKRFLHSWKRYPATILVCFLLILNIIGTVRYWSQPALQRENWRSVISQLEYKYPESSIALFSFPAAFAPWRWYATPTIYAYPSGELSLQQATAQRLVKKATDYRYIITFDYLRDLTDPNHYLNNTLTEYGYKEIEVIDYPAIGFVRIYSKPEAVISYR